MVASGRRRTLWIGLGAIAGVVVVAAGGAAIWLSQFNPNDEKPRIIALVKQATGRDLALNGTIGLKLSLQPTLQVAGVALSNPPGFSRPEMATLQRMDVQLRLLPLLHHRIEIERLVLIHPDILLETDQQGQPNWVFRSERPGEPAGTAGQQAGSQPVGTPKSSAADVLTVRNVQIEDGTIAYRDDASGKVTTLAVGKLTGTARSPDSPLHLVMDAAYDGTNFTLTGDTGSLTRLQDPASTTPWPMKLAVQTGAAKLSVDGTLTQPLQGRGYAVTINGSVPDVAALAPLVPGVRLPPLHDVTFATHLTDRGQSLPDISALVLHAGASDLAGFYPGLTLDRLDIAAPAIGQPVKVAIAAKVGDSPVAVDATLGAPEALLTQPASPAAFPVDVTAQSGGATLSAKGQIAQPRTLTGVNLALTGQIPDLAALSPLLRHPLPDLKQIALSGTLADAAGGPAGGWALQAFKLASAAGDVAGNVAVRLGATPALTADLQSQRVDGDALRAAVDSEPPASQPDASRPPSAPAGQAQPGPASPSGAPPGFAERPLPWDMLRRANADVTWSAQAVHAGGTDYRGVTAHVALQDGRLQVDPLTADLATGRLQATATADATAKVPPLSLTLHDPGLPLRPLLEAMGKPPTAAGNLEVYADLHGAGDTPHAIAASLNGSLGIAVANGSIDNRLLGATLSRILREVNLLDLVGRGGTSDVRCAASRIDFHDGIGTVRSLALSSSLLTMAGGGTINLQSDTLNLLVRPQARVAGTSLVVPIRVTGSITSPATRVDAKGAAEDNAGTVAGVVIGDATPLGLIGGMLGADKLFSGGGGDVCPAALALARGQSPPAEAAQPSKPKASGPEGFLRQLLR